MSYASKGLTIPRDAMPSARAKILIVDDELIKRTILEDELRAAGYQVATAANPMEAEPILADTVFDVVLTDLRMPGQDGLSFLRNLKRRRPDQAAMVMTAYGTVDTAVEAMKIGAFDYLQKPFTTEELLLKLDKLLRFEDLATENEALRRQLALRGDETRIIGQSEAIRKMLARIHAVAGTDATVLLVGESGTGKELAARIIHETSSRSVGPFIAVSCAALPREIVEAELFGHEAGAFTGAARRHMGRLELAHNGTLFLDDVDDIPMSIQVKLLRVLQHQTFERVGGEDSIRVNLRVISATKTSLSTMVAAGKFREDLHYRLNVVPIHLPPLRDRIDDIPLLANHFLERLATKYNRSTLTISPEAVTMLQRRAWPGNVRQLEHLLEQMVAVNQKDHFDEHDIPEPEPGAAQSELVSMALGNVQKVDLGQVVAQVETRLVRWAMDHTEGNLARAAERLGIPRSTLQYKLSKLGDVSDGQPSERDAQA